MSIFLFLNNCLSQAVDKLEEANQLLEVADGAAKRAEARLADATSRRASSQVRCVYLYIYIHAYLCRCF